MGFSIEDMIRPRTTPSSGGGRVAGYRKLEKTTGNSEYDSIYDQAGKDHDVDPNLLWAQGKQETIDFNEDVMRGRRDSPAKARGAGQFLKDTALEFGLRVDDQIDERSDPKKAIPAQARMMRKLLDRTNDVDLSLAGYNSGHNADIETLRRNLERIPETKTYRQRIRANYDGNPAAVTSFSNIDDLSRNLLTPRKASKKTAALPDLPEVPPATPQDLSAKLLGGGEPAPAAPVVAAGEGGPKGGAPVSPTFPGQMPNTLIKPDAFKPQPAKKADYVKRQIGPGDSFFQFEKDGKLDTGEEYLGTVDGKYRFKDPSGDEFEIADPKTPQPMYLGPRSKIYDGNKQEYQRSDRTDGKGQPIYTRDAEDYTVEGNDIKPFGPQKKVQSKSGGTYDLAGRKTPNGEEIYTKDGEDYTVDSKTGDIRSLNPFPKSLELHDKTPIELAEDQAGVKDGQKRYVNKDTKKTYIFDGEKARVEQPPLPKAVIKKVPAPATGVARTGAPKYEFQKTGKVKVGDKELTYDKNDQSLASDKTTTEKLPENNFRLRDEEGFGYVVNAESGEVKPESENIATVPITVYPESQRSGMKPPEIVKAEAANTIADALAASGKVTTPKSDITEWIRTAGLRHLEDETPFIDEDYYTPRGAPEKKDITITNRDIASLSDFSTKRRANLEKAALEYLASGESNPEKEKFFKANDVDFNKLNNYSDDDVKLAQTKGTVAKEDFNRFAQELKSGADTANVRYYKKQLADVGIDNTDNIGATLAASRKAGWIDDKTYKKGLEEYQQIRETVRSQIRDEKVADIRFAYPTKGEQDVKIAKIEVPNSEVDKRLDQIRKFSLSGKEKTEAGGVAEFYNSLERYPVIGDMLGFHNAAVVAPVLEAGGKGLQAIAGLIRPFSEDAAAVVSKQGSKQELAASQIIDPSRPGAGAKQAIKFIASTVAGLPEILVVSRTPLGMFGGMALTHATESYGKGESITKARQAAATGAATGLVFEVAPVLSLAARNATFRALLSDETKAALLDPAFKRAYEASKAAGESPMLIPEVRSALIRSQVIGGFTRIGTTFTGTGTVELASGKTPGEALNAAVQNTIMDFVLTHVATGADALTAAIDSIKGKVLRVKTAAGEKVVTVAKDGSINDLGNVKPDIEDAVIYSKDAPDIKDKAPVVEPDAGQAAGQTSGQVEAPESANLPDVTIKSGQTNGQTPPAKTDFNVKLSPEEEAALSAPVKVETDTGLTPPDRTRSQTAKDFQEVSAALDKVATVKDGEMSLREDATLDDLRAALGAIEKYKQVAPESLDQTSLNKHAAEIDAKLKEIETAPLDQPAGIPAQPVERQKLLLPETFDATKDEIDRANEQRKDFEHHGFKFTTLSGVLALTEIPRDMKMPEARTAFQKLVKEGTPTAQPGLPGQYEAPVEGAKPSEPAILAENEPDTKPAKAAEPLDSPTLSPPDIIAGLWGKVKQRKVTVDSGQTSDVLVAAGHARAKGGLQTEEEFAKFVHDYDQNVSDVTGDIDRQAAILDLIRRWTPAKTEKPEDVSTEVVRPKGKADNEKIPELRKPSGHVAAGNDTEVVIPASDKKYPGKYTVREIDDVYPSHNPFNFQPNQDYHFTNDRRYDQEEQYQKQVMDRSKDNGPDKFNPNILINDSPTAEVGTPIIDPSGNALGGNSRVMIMHRVYKADPENGLGYSKLLRAKAQQFGISAAELDKFNQPVLVREIAPGETIGDVQRAITELNATGTTPLTGQEQAIAASSRLSEAAIDFIADKIDSVGDASLSEVLNLHGVEIVNKLIEEGVFPGGDRNVLLDNGKVTDEGKLRIQRLLLGRIFTDLFQLEHTAPSILNNLERIIAPLSKIEGTDWDLLPHVRAALDLIQEAGDDSVRDTARQQSFVRPFLYTPATIAIAETLKGGPVQASTPFKKYAGEFQVTKSGGSLFETLSRDEAFKMFFGEEYDEPTTEKADEFKTQVAEPLSQEKLDKLNYGSINKPNVGNLAKAFYAYFNAGNSFPTIIGARKFAGDLLKGQVDAGAPVSKTVEEALETGLVMQARYLANQPRKGVSQKMRAIIDLYTVQQPNLSGRTSTSVEQQAYSTPAPLAYAVSRMVKITKKTTTYEPTAGNGMLLIEADNGILTTANELNDARRENLQTVYDRAKIEDKDATEFSPGQNKFEVIIANPPFGTGQKTVNVDANYSTNQLDHAIAFKALDSMRDDGRAVLLVAGVKGDSEETRADGYDAIAKRKFYFTLYNQYNVTDHFTVAGDLYKKQGAGFPVDVIVIKGRSKSERKLPAADVPRVIKSWDELAKEVANAERKSTRTPKQRPASSVESAEGEQPSKPGQGTSLAGGSDIRNAGAGTGQGSVPGAASGQSIVPGESGRESGSGALESVEPDAGGKPDRGTAGTGGTGLELSEQPESGRTPLSDRGLSEDAGEIEQPGREGERSPAVDESGKLGERAPDSVRRKSVIDKDDDLTGASQVPYTPESKGKAMQTLMPTNLVTSTYNSLEKLREDVGSIDDYVADKLGFTPEQMAESFGAEQVDALALAIKNIEEGSGFIIGDQTGIGKGRVVAGVLLYALRTGRTPIFVTEKPTLYKDIIRDLRDIGVDDVRPFMTNSDEKVQIDDDGLEYLVTKPGKQKALIEKMTGTGKLADDFNLLFTTYNQMQAIAKKETARREFLRAMAPNSIIVLDESHNAGGSGADKTLKPDEAADRAAFARELVDKSQGVFYSSATYAKRPEVMSLYSKTDMRFVATDTEALAEAINAGGVPLQQVVATMLADSGQYLRRERDFTGITYDTVPIKVNKKLAESASGSMLLIKQFDDIKQEAIKNIKNDVREEGGAILGDQSTGQTGMSDIKFTSIMHNLIDQMLLMLKVEGAVDEAKAALARGQKPVITLSNTMGAFIEQYADDNALHTGDAIGLNFGDMLRRYLERSREIQIGNAYGKRKRRRLTDEELDVNGVEAYKKALKYIQSTDWSGTPVSPIDYMKFKLQQEGFTVDELSGRQHTVQYNPDGSAVYRLRPQKESGSVGRAKAISGFNSGDVDAMIIGQVSAGFSLHSSEKFKNQDPRHMIILQPEKNIDAHMQKLGRVNRTGQVNLPSYGQLVADIPAEKRPAAVLLNRMASLNANTTASRESSVSAKDVLDFINQYGDEVVATLMEENPDIHKLLGLPLKESKSHPGLDREGAARKVTGRIPLLPIKQQEELYGLIETEYQDYVDRLTALGENKLAAETLDLRAETLYRTEVSPGTGDKPFQRGAFAEEVDARRLVKPLSSDQVKAALTKTLDLPENASFSDIKNAGYKKTADQRLDWRKKIAEYIDKELEQIPDLDKKRAARTRLEGLQNRLTGLLNVAHIGAPVQIDGLLGTRYGIIGNVKHKGNLKNPTALSGYEVQVFLPDAGRQMNVAVSKLYTEANKPADIDSPNILVIKQSPEFVARDGTKMPMIEAFDRGALETTERRTIITGNLLAGYTEFKKGRIINYTTKDGDLQQGILMPHDFQVSKALAAKEIEFKTPEHIIKFLSPGGRIVKDKTGDMRITFAQNRYKFAVPASKARGGKYFLNHGILSAADRDFVKVGPNMMLELKEPEARAVIEELIEQGVKLQTDSFKDEARKIVGAVMPEVKTAVADKPSGMPAKKGEKPETSVVKQAPPETPTVPDPLSPTGAKTSLEDDSIVHAKLLSGTELETSPVPLPGYEKSKVSTTDVIKSYAGILDTLGNETPVRIGRISQRNTLGLYKPHAEVIRLLAADDLPTAAHEVGHGLQKAIYGAVTAKALKDIPLPAQRELLDLGKDLYGTLTPAGGYKSEGFAEFIRLYLTTDDAPATAPETVRYFEEEVLGTNPDLAKAFTAARAQTDAYRSEGAQGRAAANIKQPPKLIERLNEIRKNLRKDLAREMVDELSPMIYLSREVEKIAGRKLAPSEDPAQVAQFTRSLAYSRVQYFLYHGMLDAAGNRVDGVMPLKDIMALVRGKEDSWLQYMWARRSLERWEKEKNPGMSKEDAEHLMLMLDSPEFQLAANEYYKWNEGLLNYYRGMVPEMGPAIDQIMADSLDYIPLMRAMDDFDVPKMAGKYGKMATGDPLKRMTGSGRRVNAFLPQIIANAEKLVAMAHKNRIINTLLDLEKIEGVGKVLEEVPKDQVPTTVSIEKIRKALEDKGADLSNVEDMDEVITFFTPAQYPKGTDPIIPVMRDGTVKWYYIPADLYNSLQGLDVYRLPQALSLVGVSARAFRLGTTGLRPSFSLVTNPLRDIITLMAQSRTKNPAALLLNYFRAIGSGLNPARLVGYQPKWIDFGERLGIPMAQPLATDIAQSGIFQNQTVKAAKQLQRNMPHRIVASPINALREALGVTEMMPREAELRTLAKEIGYEIGTPMSFDQSIVMGLGPRQVTVDFTATGKTGKILNQMIPFLNAGIQGNRGFVRTFRDRPLRGLIFGLQLALLSLMLWWLNKDEEWYQEMPEREKAMYWSFRMGDKILQIPKSQEWGALFGSLPEAAANAWYQKDPDSLKASLGFILDMTTPNIEPPVVRAAREQWSNRVEFFDRPIVPESEKDKPPVEQYGRYTSEVAKFIARQLPATTITGVPVNSPRRIDAFIREMFGGLGSDIAHVADASKRGREASDIPVFGRLFRAGGLDGFSSKTIDKFYADYAKAKEREASDVPENDEDRNHRLILEDANKAMKLLRLAALESENAPKRAEINALMRSLAKRAMSDQTNYNPLPTPQDREEQDTEKKQRSDNKRMERLLGEDTGSQFAAPAPQDAAAQKMVDQGAAEYKKGPAEFEKWKQSLRQMETAGVLDRKDRHDIEDRARTGELYDIFSGNPQDAANAFDRIMQSGPDETRKNKAVKALQDKYDRAESETSKQFYLNVAKKHSIELKQR